MKRGKKKDVVAEPQVAPEEPEDLTPAVDGSWDGPTRAGDEGEIAELAAESAREEAAGDVVLEAPAGVEGPEIAQASAAEGGAGEGAVEAAAVEGVQGQMDDEEPPPEVESPGRLESILESLLYAADKALSVTELKRLVNERDSKKIAAALEALRERHADTGIQLASLAGGWQFRTHPANAAWVGKLIAGRPQRLSRAMLEALAIVAYRQPITRPEIDEIRGVDCGPVLKTLLDRGFIRILGKREDVGRPMLYGTTPEFLKTFSLRDLSELPTLREFHELSEQQMADVDAKAPLPEGASAPEGAPPADASADASRARSPFAPTPMDLAPVDQEEEEALLEELDNATVAATRASGPPPGQQPEASASPESTEPQS